MAHGERSSWLEHVRGRDYWGKLHYLCGRDRESKRISHRIERAYQKRILLKELTDVKKGI